MRVAGRIVDVLNEEIYSGMLEISGGRITDITRDGKDCGNYILPGFIDSHVHIESSMLTPSEFARASVIHGTVATVSDPHEIANVLGLEGVKYMIDNAKRVPFKFYFSAPSCVPATSFETSGAVLGPKEVEELLAMKEIRYLGEMMDFQGVINRDFTVMEKIGIAKKYGKPIDGHAPGFTGEILEKYVGAGITTDHECFTKAEALEKIGLGMKIQIREGSAAKNFEELLPLLEKHHDKCMFCSDDKHPDDLLKGHINDLVKRSLNYGIDLMKALKVACVNPVIHYKLDVGLLQKGDYADFIIVDNLKDFNVLQTYVNGELVAENGKTLIKRSETKKVNKFLVEEKNIDDFALHYKKGRINVIKVEDGRVVTGRLLAEPRVIKGYVVADSERDILKVAVVNRYEEARPAIGFINNFGLKNGAIASSVAHDSHNIIAVGTSDEEINRAVNLIIRSGGGISAVSGEEKKVLPLPIAGIMSDQDCRKVAKKHGEVEGMAKSLGSKLHAPFMTLSFMTLPVIPKLKMTDKGLFDTEKSEFIDVFED